MEVPSRAHHTGWVVKFSNKNTNDPTKNNRTPTLADELGNG